jgi:CMP/dCMP kinase
MPWRPSVRNLTVAVDGPASSGKGTVARAAARHYGWQYVDTGAMYRSVALVARERGVAWDDESRLGPLAASLSFSFGWDGEIQRVSVGGRDVTEAIRTAEMGVGSSAVSKLPAVRAALLDLQRDLGGRGGVVMDGRDIGTVVLPGADLKIYLDADVRERARRRTEELRARGEPADLDEIAKALEARDRQDMGRAIAPLECADDAIVLDTTRLSIPQSIAAVIELIERAAASDPR